MGSEYKRRIPQEDATPGPLDHGDGKITMNVREGGTSVCRVASTVLHTRYGDAQLHVFQRPDHPEVAVADYRRSRCAGTPVVVRIHSVCATSDQFASLHCDCAEQLVYAHRRCARDGGLVILESAHEGRGLGLTAKIRAYELMQASGVDTYEANRRLGLPEDARRYDDAAAILLELGVSKIHLLTENPQKAAGLQARGLTVVRCEPLPVVVELAARRYRETKLSYWAGDGARP